MMPALAGSICLLALLVPVSAAAQSPASAPCAPPNAPDPMPEGATHNHADPAQHRFACGIELVASSDLMKEVPEPTLFGEVDVAGNLAVMATTFPEAGFVVFDVSNPRKPVFLSQFRATKCERETDVDCGADVKLHPNGRLAFLAVQRSSRSTRAEKNRIRPGIAVVDLRDPRHPKQASFLALPPVGAHLLTYHQIGGTGYVFARVRPNGRGVLPLPTDADPRGGPGFGIYRLGGTTLTRVAEVRTPDSHDVSLYDDPLDAKTYLAVPGGRSSRLFFYDVSTPAQPKALGSWKPPDDGTKEGWYIHDATIFRSGNKRFAVTGAEQFSAQPFHGKSAGTVWMLDVTSFAAPILLGQWSNPGAHPAGDLTMSTHTSSFADGFTWTAHYHGGVWLLDWRKVVAGQAQRPTEAGFYVPHETNRPFVVNDVKDPFITAPGLKVRPLVWDAFFAGGYAYVSDINGGFVVLERETKPSAAPRHSNGFPVGVVLAIGGAALAATTAALAAQRRRVRAGVD